MAEPTETRPQARIQYLASLKQTASMPLGLLLTGHGDAVADHRALVRRRFAEHRRRCQRILAALEEGPAHAYGIAKHLWSARTVAEQPLLVVWEVLGHLDLLLDEGTVAERVFDDGKGERGGSRCRRVQEHRHAVRVPVGGDQVGQTVAVNVDNASAGVSAASVCKRFGKTPRRACRCPQPRAGRYIDIPVLNDIDLAVTVYVGKTDTVIYEG